MNKCYYPFNISFTDNQRNELLSIAKKIKFESIYNEGNFFSTDINQVNSNIPTWLYKMFNFSYRRIIFLFNDGNVTPHKDNGRTSVITFPLNQTDGELVWTNTNQRLKYNTNSFLINVEKTHHVEVPKTVDRYFLQLPLNNSWNYNVEYFYRKKLIL
jgi:hypothetical protein|tara:strand:- start:43 stop:513 length:471 start_codon:yes stop_codon:yes gene_type:complete